MKIALLIAFLAQDAPGVVIPAPPDGDPARRQALVQRKLDAARVDEGAAEDVRKPVLDSSAFDLYLLGNAWTEEVALRKLNERLAFKVEMMARQLGLTDRERARLLLAGKGDIKRLFERVRVEREEFEEARWERSPAIAAITRIKELSVEMRSGPFEADSLFMKALRKILSDRAKSERRQQSTFL